MKTYHVEFISDRVSNSIDYLTIRIGDEEEILTHIRDFYGKMEVYWRLISQ